MDLLLQEAIKILTLCEDGQSPTVTGYTHIDEDKDDKKKVETKKVERPIIKTEPPVMFKVGDTVYYRDSDKENDWSKTGTVTAITQNEVFIDIDGGGNVSRSKSDVNLTPPEDEEKMEECIMMANNLLINE